MHIVRSRLSLPLLLTLALSACAQQPPQLPVAPPPPMIASGQCNESAAQFALGKVADAKLAEEVRIRASAQRVRMIHPGEMVTMEFDARRITLDIGADGKVVKARCG